MIYYLVSCVLVVLVGLYLVPPYASGPISATHPYSEPGMVKKFQKVWTCVEGVFNHKTQKVLKDA